MSETWRRVGCGDKAIGAGVVGAIGLLAPGFAARHLSTGALQPNTALFG